MSTFRDDNIAKKETLTKLMWGGVKLAIKADMINKISG